MNNLFFLWLAGAILFLVLEMGHPGLFYFLSFAFGALGAALAVLVTPIWSIQIATFIVTTIVAFKVLKAWITRKEQSVQATNSDALVDREGTVTAEIRPGQLGYVKVGSEVWAARTDSQTIITANSRVTVVAVRGAHVVVKQVTQ